MMRGRPNNRQTTRQYILNKLSNTDLPMTVSMLTRELSNSLNKNVSWNTVQKYLQELVESGKVQPIQLPHSKEANKTGLVVYTLKK